MAFDWKSLVRTVAPVIGTALGGPMGGMAIKAVSSAVLGKPDGTEAEIAQALSGASQETLLALKKADQDFEIRMKELDVDLDRMAFDDAKNARNRQIATKDQVPAWLAFILLAMFAGALAGLFWVEIPENNKAMVYSMVGSLATLTIAGCAYYHGSSRGSARKDMMRMSLSK